MTSAIPVSLSLSYALLNAQKRQGPLIDLPELADTKDPCPVFDGTQWHIFATGWSVEAGTHVVFHMTSKDLYGPWQVEKPTTLEGVSSHQLAAPGVVWDEEAGCFHMFIQTLFNQPNGVIEHLTSPDGKHFIYRDTILKSIPGSAESGIYDPHPALIHGQKYITYSAFSGVGQPEIYLAKSTNNTWYGPWERLGCIVQHSDLDHHNQPGHPDYEWGLEGSQLIELPDGKVLLNAVCFLPEGTPGTRQRVFFAVAESPAGPYYSLGPVLMPGVAAWESAENGHAAAVLYNNALHLFYQARSVDTPWRFGHAEFKITK